MLVRACRAFTVALALVAVLAGPASASDPDSRGVGPPSIGATVSTAAGQAATIRRAVVWMEAVRLHPAPARHATPVRIQRVAAIYATGSVNGYPCGGDLPTCSILRCESGGDPTAKNPTTSASGLWQILRSTWARFGGYLEAWMAPPSVQNEKARLIWNGGAGRSQWSC